MCVCARATCVLGVHGDQKWVSDPLELELQVAVSRKCHGNAGTEPGLLQSQSHHTPPLTTCFKSIMEYVCVCMHVHTYIDACGRTLVEAFGIGCLDHSPPYTPRQGLLLNRSLGIHLASYALGLQGSHYTHWVFTQILGIRILAFKFKQEMFGLLNYFSRNPHSHLPPPPKPTM